MGRCKCGQDTGWGGGDECSGCSKKKQEQRLNHCKYGEGHLFDIKFGRGHTGGSIKIVRCLRPLCGLYEEISI